jgi:hypothetical protein
VVPVALPSPLGRAEAERVVGQVAALLRDRRCDLECRVTGPADLRLVDVLARLALLARRRGCHLRVRGAGSDLAGLLLVTGLQEALAAPLQALGEAEAGEQPRVEEVVDVDELPP